jgi:phage shock protein A
VVSLFAACSSSAAVAAAAAGLQDDWLKRAELAVSKGEDELAREALKRRKAYQVRHCVVSFS